MSQVEAFSLFAKLLEEMCPAQAARIPWVDQSYLPEEVRALWRAVGVAKFARKLAPVSAEQEQSRLEQAFEEWFSHAAIRDKWKLEPTDEPIPWRHLPPKPRLVGELDGPYLIASDQDPAPPLFLFHDSSPVGKRLDYSYLRFCCDWLFRWGTQHNTASVHEGTSLLKKPAVPGLDADISQLGDGIYTMDDVAIAFRDIATYSEFVLARPADEQCLFQQPVGAYFDVKRPKSLPIDPRDSKPSSGFVRHQAAGWGELAGGKGLIGTLAGAAVWIQAQDGPVGEIRVTCDPVRAESVRTWLAERCVMLDSGLGQRMYTLDLD